MWAILLLILVDKRRLIAYLPGLAVGGTVVLLSMWLVNGTVIPLQILSNYSDITWSLQAIINSAQVLLAPIYSPFWYYIALSIITLSIIFLRFNNIAGLIAGLSLLIVYTALSSHLLLDPPPDGLLARSTGLFISAPLAVIWLLMPGSAIENRLRWMIVIFVTIITVLHPVPDGIHYSPRFLLPVMIIGGMGFLTSLYDRDSKQRAILLGLLIISVVIQVRFTTQLASQMDANREFRTEVRRVVDDSPLLISGWYYGGDLANDLGELNALYPGNHAGWVELLTVLERNDLDRFYHLRQPGYGGPEQDQELHSRLIEIVADGEGWEIAEYHLMPGSIPSR